MSHFFYCTTVKDWNLGDRDDVSAKRRGPTTKRNIVKNAVENTQTCFNASVYRWKCHQCKLENIVRIQNISEKLTCSLCGYQRASSDDMESKKNEMDWFKIVNAVKHEMSPFIANAIKRTLKYLNKKDVFWDPSDLSDTSIKAVITRLQKIVALKTKDVNYLQRLLRRAQFQDDWWRAHEFTS